MDGLVNDIFTLPLVLPPTNLSHSVSLINCSGWQFELDKNRPMPFVIVENSDISIRDGSVRPDSISDEDIVMPTIMNNRPPNGPVHIETGVKCGTMQRWRGGTYDGKIAGLYDLEATLGRGHFAVVKLARHVFTGEKVAVKVIDKSKLDEVSRAHLFQEVRCMKLVQHPNVVRLYEVIDTQTKLYLVLELADGGDLYDYIMRHDRGLSEPLARHYFRQIVRAISYCHRLHVVHRDLKPENVVFFERSGVVKLTDFGFSNRFCPGQKLETSCGSLAYSAPEILLGDSYDAPAVDVWSLGVILYMLVCGQAPFQEANDSETLTMIMDCKYTVPNHVSQACKSLIGRMLVREPEKRASLEQISKDTWLDAQLELAQPLVSSRSLSESDHSTIVQKMVNGNICTKEEILEALERNEYNYITATYFLLAERMLRAQEPKQHPKMKTTPTVRVESCTENDITLKPGQNIVSLTRSPGDITQRSRKCSIVTEDDEEDSCSSRCESGGLNRRGSRSEGKLHLAVQEIHRQAIPINSITEASTAPGPLHPGNGNTSGGHHTPVRAVKTLPSPLGSALSSPQLGVSTSSISRYERRGKLRKGSTASCSSSDASDEDSEGRNKRKGSNKSLHRGRGGPHDPGANGDGSGGGGGGGGRGGGSGGGGGGTDRGGSDKGGSGGDSSGAGSHTTTNHEGHNSTTGRNTQPHANPGGRRHQSSGGGVNSGRRRGETRLRESQSLNRITEVQESEPAVTSAGTTAATETGSATTTAGENNITTLHPVAHTSPIVATPAVVVSPQVKQHGGKRSALIGRYLSLQRKLCIPLLGGGGRNGGGGFVRSSYKDINQNVGSTAAVAAAVGMCHHIHSASPASPNATKCCSLC